MGTLKRQAFTIPMPDGAKVKGDVVTWTAKGKTKTGKLSPDTGRVLVHSETWTARYKDEAGKTVEVSTKCRDRAAANRVLAKLENEVIQIRTGAVSRRDIDLDRAQSEPLAKHLADFYVAQAAKGVGQVQMKHDRTMLPRFFSEADIETLDEITKQTLEKWIVGCLEGRIVAPIKKRQRGPRTINSYIDRLRVFCRWAVDEKRMREDPTEKIKDQNEAVDKRKDRIALTAEEVQKLLEIAKTRHRRSSGILSGDEVEMIYRTALGTGLRSSELAALLVHQIEPAKQRIVLRAATTKNKKAAFQPISEELAELLAAWIKDKQPGDRVFSHDKYSLLSSFKRDCKAAGIERKRADGRSVDVHCLRRTFGTMLARAGVPLTTVQKLMRHSTPELTAKLYIDVEEIDLQEAVGKLPAW